MKKKKGLIVFSVGDNAISKNNIIDYKTIERVSMVISNLVNQDYSVVLVSAGAILMGMKKMGVTHYPGNIPNSQALASLGQVELIATYQKIFHQFNKNVAQLLLTREIMKSHTRVKNAKSTLAKLLAMDYIPIVNENDTVSVEDIQLKDNYPLASVVANFLNANCMVVKKRLEGEFLFIKQNVNQISRLTSEREIYEYLCKKEPDNDDVRLKSFPLLLNETI